LSELLELFDEGGDSRLGAEDLLLVKIQAFLIIWWRGRRKWRSVKIYVD
jgi:hypothetical protein